jgi:hypothetical protein
MKQIIILAAIISTTLSSGIAQPTVYLKGGFSHSNWNGDGLNLFSSLVDITGSEWIKQQGMNSYFAGVGIDMPVAGKFRVESGLYYGRVGASIGGNLAFKALELLGISAGATAISQRLEVPVLAKYEVVKGLRLVAGPQLNYAFNNDVRLRASVLGINLVNRSVSINNYVEPFSASAVGGVQYAFNNGWQVQATYEQGLTRIARNNSADIYQNNIRVGLGIPVFGIK